MQLCASSTCFFCRHKINICNYNSLLVSHSKLDRYIHMHICMHTYTHSHTANLLQRTKHVHSYAAYMYTYIKTCVHCSLAGQTTHADSYAHMHKYIQTYMHCCFAQLAILFTCVCVHIHIHILLFCAANNKHTLMCTRAHMCTCTYTYIHSYIHTYIHCFAQQSRNGGRVTRSR